MSGVSVRHKIEMAWKGKRCEMQTKKEQLYKLFCKGFVPGDKEVRCIANYHTCSSYFFKWKEDTSAGRLMTAERKKMDRVRAIVEGKTEPAPIKRMLFRCQFGALLFRVGPFMIKIGTLR